MELEKGVVLPQDNPVNIEEGELREEIYPQQVHQAAPSQYNSPSRPINSPPSSSPMSPLPIATCINRKWVDNCFFFSVDPGNGNRTRPRPLRLRQIPLQPSPKRSQGVSGAARTASTSTPRSGPRRSPRRTASASPDAHRPRTQKAPLARVISNNTEMVHHQMAVAVMMRVTEGRESDLLLITITVTITVTVATAETRTPAAAAAAASAVPPPRRRPWTKSGPRARKPQQRPVVPTQVRQRKGETKGKGE